MGHPLQLFLAMLVLCEWCTQTEAEAMSVMLTGTEIPQTVAECIRQLESTRDVVRSRL